MQPWSRDRVTLYESRPLGESSERGRNQPVGVTRVSVKGGPLRRQTRFPCPTASVHLPPQPRLPVTFVILKKAGTTSEKVLREWEPLPRLGSGCPPEAVPTGRCRAAGGGLGASEGPGRGGEKRRSAEKEKQESAGKPWGRPRARGEVWDAQRPRTREKDRRATNCRSGPKHMGG